MEKTHNIRTVQEVSAAMQPPQTVQSKATMDRIVVEMLHELCAALRKQFAKLGRRAEAPHTNINFPWSKIVRGKNSIALRGRLAVLKRDESPYPADKGLAPIDYEELMNEAIARRVGTVRVRDLTPWTTDSRPTLLYAVNHADYGLNLEMGLLEALPQNVERSFFYRNMLARLEDRIQFTTDEGGFDNSEPPFPSHVLWRYDATSPADGIPVVPQPIFDTQRVSVVKVPQMKMRPATFVEEKDFITPLSEIVATIARKTEILAKRATGETA